MGSPVLPKYLRTMHLCQEGAAYGRILGSLSDRRTIAKRRERSRRSRVSTYRFMYINHTDFFGMIKKSYRFFNMDKTEVQEYIPGVGKPWSREYLWPFGSPNSVHRSPQSPMSLWSIRKFWTFVLAYGFYFNLIHCL